MTECSQIWKWNLCPSCIFLTNFCVGVAFLPWIYGFHKGFVWVHERYTCERRDWLLTLELCFYLLVCSGGQHKILFSYLEVSHTTTQTLGFLNLFSIGKKNIFIFQKNLKCSTVTKQLLEHFNESNVNICK